MRGGVGRTSGGRFREGDLGWYHGELQVIIIERIGRTAGCTHWRRGRIAIVVVEGVQRQIGRAHV